LVYIPRIFLLRLADWLFLLFCSMWTIINIKLVIKVYDCLERCLDSSSASCCRQCVHK
jgi:hypothetical protein